MAGAEWGIRMEPAEIEDAIRAIGRTPMERTTTYEPVQRNDFGAPSVVPVGHVAIDSRR